MPLTITLEKVIDRQGEQTMKTQKALKVITLLFAVATSTAIIACASGERGGRRQGPPPEAIEACSGKSEGESVTFSGRRGDTVKATCQTVNEQLVAVPEDHESRQRQ